MMNRGISTCYRITKQIVIALLAMQILFGINSFLYLNKQELVFYERGFSKLCILFCTKLKRYIWRNAVWLIPTARDIYEILFSAGEATTGVVCAYWKFITPLSTWYFLRSSVFCHLVEKYAFLTLFEPYWKYSINMTFDRKTFFLSLPPFRKYSSTYSLGSKLHQTIFITADIQTRAPLSLHSELEASCLTASILIS